MARAVHGQIAREIKIKQGKKSLLIVARSLKTKPTPTTILIHASWKHGKLNIRGHPLFHSDFTMRGLTLTWTPITLVLAILLTSPFPTQAQSRERIITRAQVEEVIKNYKQPSGTQERREQKLKRLLNCTQDISEWCNGRRKSLVVKELLLRRQIRDIDEECTSDGNYSTALYSSPYRVPDNNGRPHLQHPEETFVYETWQDELLDTGLTFCDPINRLSCSPISKKCECLPGTEWNADVIPATCSNTILGGYCWPPGEIHGLSAVTLYDPISSPLFDGSSVIPLSGCTEQFGCDSGVVLKVFFPKLCLNKTLYDLDQKLGNQFKDLPRLNFGESCNLEHQTQLYKTTDAEVKDYKIRVKNLEAILAAKTQFCDPKLLLMCGNDGKCECIQPTTFDSGTKLCTFKNPHKACQGQTTFGKMAAKFTIRVGNEVMEGFKTVRDRECPLKCAQAKYPGGGLVVPFFSFCRLCPENQNLPGRISLVGKNCDKSLTRFLDGAPPPSLPIDIPDYDKQLELFVQFNEKAKEFEKLFRLGETSPCNYVGELDAYRSIRRIKNVELPDKVFTGQNYKDLMSSMDKHIGQFGGKGLCATAISNSNRASRERRFLLCGPTLYNPVCYYSNNTLYFEELLKRLSEKSFQATPSGSCSPHPRDIFNYAAGRFGRFVEPVGAPVELTPVAYEYVFTALENHWIDNSQFCNRTGGFKCTKAVDDKTNATGKCEFSKDVLDEPSKHS